MSNAGFLIAMVIGKIVRYGIGVMAIHHYSDSWSLSVAFAVLLITIDEAKCKELGK